MGTTYYLWRDDTGTAYELGKNWELSQVFDAQRGIALGETQSIVREQDADVLAEMIELALWTPALSRREPTDLDVQWTYDVALDIARWSEGQPFRFLSEHASEIERASDKAHEDFERVQRPSPTTQLRYRAAYITGSLYRDLDRTIPRPRNAAAQRCMIGSHYWLAIEMMFHGIALIISGFYWAAPVRGICGGYERGLEAVDGAIPAR